MRKILYFTVVCSIIELCTGCYQGEIGTPITLKKSIGSGMAIQARTHKSNRKEPKLDGIPLSCRLVAVRKGEYDIDRFYALAEIAVSYSEARQHEEALQLTKEIRVDTYRNTALSKISAYYADDGRYDQAIQLAEVISNTKNGNVPAEKFIALTHISSQLAKKGQYNRALQVVRQINEPSYRASALAHIAQEYAKAGQRTNAETIFVQVLETAQNITNEKHSRIRAFPKAVALSQISISYAEVGQYEQALSVAKKIQNSTYKAYALRQIAIKYGISGRQDEAARILSTVPEPSEAVFRKSQPNFKVRALVDIVGAYAAAGLHEQALSMAKTIQGDMERFQVLIGLSKVYINLGEYDMANEGLRLAFQIIKSQKSGDQKVRALISIASSYLKAKRLEEFDNILLQALQLSEDINSFRGEIDLKALNFDRIARTYASAGQYSKALQIAKKIEDKIHRSVLIELFECAEQYDNSDHSLN